MSKSYDNYVGLAQAPEEQFGRTMSIPDALLEEWYRLASGLEGVALEGALSLAANDPYRANPRAASTSYTGIAACPTTFRSWRWRRTMKRWRSKTDGCGCRGSWCA
jgi:hypothetical protein